MSKNTKTRFPDYSSDESLLQQLIGENFYPQTDLVFHAFTEGPLFAAERWDEANLLDSLRRIDALSLRAEMRLRDLKKLLKKQPARRC